MRCFGVGMVANHRVWQLGNGGYRRADTVTCPACGKTGIAPRKDGTVRAHVPASRVASAPANPVPVPRVGRVVTQK